MQSTSRATHRAPTRLLLPSVCSALRRQWLQAIPINGSFNLLGPAVAVVPQLHNSKPASVCAVTAR